MHGIREAASPGRDKAPRAGKRKDCRILNRAWALKPGIVREFSCRPPFDASTLPIRLVQTRTPGGMAGKVREGQPGSMARPPAMAALYLELLIAKP